MAKILFVEDDAMIASGIKYALEMEGYETTHVVNAGDTAILTGTIFSFIIWGSIQF